ncbi:MAG: N-acetylglucosamine-6-phosphate deacetylase [Betaproteobacteria bacterium]|nr:MAG: N-acetylglucosamine-6-phosphate deacetylase [Betaproteobacteria bacterium]
MTYQLRGYIATEDGFIEGQVSFAGGRIESIAGHPIDSARLRSGDRPIVVPGFVDLHVHGGGGHDMMDAGNACGAIARLHAQHGTTAMLATTLTAPRDDLVHAFTGLADVMSAQQTTSVFGARILGVHLEGPYISDGKLGAQPPFARDFDEEELQALHAVAPIKLITLAPELPGANETIQNLSRAGFVVQLGHSEASYEEGRAGFMSGARGVTHLFNAMSGMHHRKPGLVGAALAHSRYAEIIPDLQHVHEGALRVAMRSIPCVYCVTDSTAAAGMPDGEYRLGRHTVSKCLGGVRLPDGTLAGSTLTMDEAFRNLVNVLQLDLLSAVRRTSTYACDFLNIADRGRIAPGAFADLLVLDRDLKLTDVFVEGRSQERA